jgi:hypothetical protein
LLFASEQNVEESTLQDFLLQESDAGGLHLWRTTGTRKRQDRIVFLSNRSMILCKVTALAGAAVVL